MYCRWWLYSWNKTRRFLSPAILISRLLLRTSIRLKRSFGIPLRIHGMHRTHFDHCAFEPSISILSLVIWSRVLWPSVKLTQSTALEPKRFARRSLSPPLHNSWLLLVRTIDIPQFRANSLLSSRLVGIGRLTWLNNGWSGISLNLLENSIYIFKCKHA